MIKIVGIGLGAIVLLLILIFFLRSGGGAPATSIDQIALALAVDSVNQPTTLASVVPSSAEEIFVVGQINQPKDNTTARVRWIKLPNTILATEDFEGRRNQVAKFDFDETKASSFFASRITRPSVAWELGEYKAEVLVNGSLATSVFFEVVSDLAAEEENAKGLVRAISFGDALAGSDSLQTSKTTFTRSTPTIYIAVVPSTNAAGARLEMEVRHIRSGLTINTFTATLGNEESLIFDLPLSRYNRFWADRLWPTGSFEVVTKVNGIEIDSPSFTIQ